MSREFTFFRFDVDEDAVRSILASIPGVTPVPADELAGDETDESSSDVETGASANGVDDASTTGPGTGPTDETAAGVETHLDDAAGESRPTATTWTRPSTPWPGAPADDAADEDEGLLARLREKKLLIGGVAAVLGVVGSVAVWFLKFRDGGSGGDVAASGRRGAGRDATPDEPHADDADSREYPVDAAPVVGIAFLAVATVLLRRFGSEREGDRPSRVE